jgi:hypothetical protein
MNFLKHLSLISNFCSAKCGILYFKCITIVNINLLEISSSWALKIWQFIKELSEYVAQNDKIYTTNNFEEGFLYSMKNNMVNSTAISDHESIDNGNYGSLKTTKTKHLHI